MPSRHPTYTKGQFIQSPALEHLDEFLYERFTSLTAADTWAAERAASGNPVPNGKVILILGEYQLYHWTGTAFQRVFVRGTATRDIDPLELGTVPDRDLDWHRKPVALDAVQYWALVEQGRLAVTEWPFTSTAGPGAGLAVEGPHQNHMAATLTVNQTLTFQTDVTMEVICIGAGGPGQNWTRNGFLLSGTRFAGGAGGGAGAVTYQVVRFERGDILAATTGSNTGSYTASVSRLVLNNNTLLYAPGGQPYVNGTTWRGRTDTGTNANPRVTGSGAGTATESTEGQRSVPLKYRNIASGTNLTSSAIQYTPPISSVMSLPLRVNDGAQGLAIKFGAANLSTYQYWMWLAGGGGGAGGDAPRPTTTESTLANNREHEVNGNRVSNTGGAGVSIPWWTTARNFAFGGPPGSNFGFGNSRRIGLAIVEGEPTDYGSGGRGGGGASGQDGGARGQPGCILLRWPTIGNPLVTTTIAST